MLEPIPQEIRRSGVYDSVTQLEKLALAGDGQFIHSYRGKGTDADKWVNTVGGKMSRYLSAHFHFLSGRVGG